MDKIIEKIKNLSVQQVEHLEYKYNVYINISNGTYNKCNYDAIYGWSKIPQNWIEEAEEYQEPERKII